MHISITEQNIEQNIGQNTKQKIKQKIPRKITQNTNSKTAATQELMLIYGKEATTQIENSVPYYSVSKWSSNTKMLLLHFHAP